MVGAVARRWSAPHLHTAGTLSLVGCDVAQFHHGSPTWRRLRLMVLERDGHLCQLRGPRCTMKATEVDHIVPLADGGDWYEPVNLRASCKPCNAGRMMRERVADVVPVRRPSRRW